MKVSQSYHHYYIQQFIFEKYLHGGVGSVDAEKVFEAYGFTPIAFPNQTDFSFRAKIRRSFYLIRTIATIKKPAIVFIIVPIYATIVRLLLKYLLKHPRIKIVFFIMDIDGLKGGDQSVLNDEKKIYRQVNYFVVHNDRMGDWFRAVNPIAKISSLHFHNFSTPPVSIPRVKSACVAFAGNLEKSPFLAQLYLLQHEAPDLHFNLYGPGANAAFTNQSNVSFKGVFEPYEMPSKIEGSFGLIWEGDSIHETSAGIGLYTRYISNHKLSLYVLSGLPIILWENAGAVYLLEKYRIGFTIKNLHEISEKINAISDSDYLQMQQNMKPLAEKISQGLFQKEAMNELLQNMQ